MGAAGHEQWVEQRSLRFGDPLDPPENIMIVDQPCICQKAYMCVDLNAATHSRAFATADSC
jgi:hypothetical protein